MTQHPSLRASNQSKQHRSVLKRFERLKHLVQKGEWEEGKSIFGLPKIKILKFKIKKEKAVVEEAAAGTQAAPGAAQEGKPAAKEGAATKAGAGAKGQAPAGKKDEKSATGKEEKGKK